MRESVRIEYSIAPNKQFTLARPDVEMGDIISPVKMRWLWFGSGFAFGFCVVFFL